MTDLTHRFAEVTKAVDDVLVAGHAMQSHLKPGSPAFFTDEGAHISIADAAAFFSADRYDGTPGPLFDVWVLCRSIAVLRKVWTGK